VVEAKLNWIDGERFVVNASSGHAVVVDADRKRNTAAGPMELVLMGLCACTATDVVSILRKKREAFTALEVRAEAERAEQPPTVYTRIKLIYTVSGQVSRKSSGGRRAALRGEILLGGRHAEEHSQNHMGDRT
jgi:putative redox protein